MTQGVNVQQNSDNSSGVRKLLLKCLTKENEGEVVCQADRTAGVKVAAKLTVGERSVRYIITTQ